MRLRPYYVCGRKYYGMNYFRPIAPCLFSFACRTIQRDLMFSTAPSAHIWNILCIGPSSFDEWTIEARIQVQTLRNLT